MSIPVATTRRPSFLVHEHIVATSSELRLASERFFFVLTLLLQDRQSRQSRRKTPRQRIDLVMVNPDIDTWHHLRMYCVKAKTIKITFEGQTRGHRRDVSRGTWCRDGVDSASTRASGTFKFEANGKFSLKELFTGNPKPLGDVEQWRSTLVAQMAFLCIDVPW